MTTAPHPHVIAFGDHVLTPGEKFEPYPDEIPGFVVTFGGVHEGRVHLHDGKRAISVPLSDIAAD